MIISDVSMMIRCLRTHFNSISFSFFQSLCYNWRHWRLSVWTTVVKGINFILIYFNIIIYFLNTIFKWICKCRGFTLFFAKLEFGQSQTLFYTSFRGYFIKLKIILFIRLFFNPFVAHNPRLIRLHGVIIIIINITDHVYVQGWIQKGSMSQLIPPPPSVSLLWNIKQMIHYLAYW